MRQSLILWGWEMEISHHQKKPSSPSLKIGVGNFEPCACADGLHFRGTFYGNGTPDFRKLPQSSCCWFGFLLCTERVFFQHQRSLEY
ncbi:hypothetical protein KCP73_01040 [Salmonella enterica subsp. enterica]|nr:hypothetical protein KCP73_01040 [Salmonella enterica subsp. enterica]